MNTITSGNINEFDSGLDDVRDFLHYLKNQQNDINGAIMAAKVILKGTNKVSHENDYNNGAAIAAHDFIAEFENVKNKKYLIVNDSGNIVGEYDNEDLRNKIFTIIDTSMSLINHPIEFSCEDVNNDS